MPVNIKLFNVGICGGMGGHGPINSFGWINGMADWFGKVNKSVEDRFYIIKEDLLETDNFRSVRNLVKVAEFTEME